MQAYAAIFFQNGNHDLWAEKNEKKHTLTLS